MRFEIAALLSGTLLFGLLSFFFIAPTPASAMENSDEMHTEAAPAPSPGSRPNNPLAANIPATPSDGIVRRSTGAYRIGYEIINMPLRDRMGLASLNYLVDVTPWFRTGLGLYGSAAGQYGGFFTGGIENQVRLNIHKKLYLDAGLFLGGGGGGAIAGQGGGLMVRPHAGIGYAFDRFSVGAELSHVAFPNGAIESTQAALILELPFGYIYTDDDYTGKKIPTYALSKIEPDLKESNESFAANTYIISAAKQTYFAHARAIKNGGRGRQKDVGLTGFSLLRRSSGGSFGYLEANGASGGNSDGYADGFFGQGYEFHPFESEELSLTATGMFGAGGGGHVSTGGGIMLKAVGGIMWQYSGLSIGASGGYVIAPFGDFHGALLSLNAGFKTDVTTLERSSENAPYKPANERAVTGWSIRGSNQTYISGKIARKAGGTQSENVNLIAMKIDRMLSGRFYVTGQGLSAYAGRSGGYSVGLIGAGLKQPIDGTDLKIIGEVLVGAAGGGGLAVGGGAIIQPMAGLSMPIAKNFDLQISLGWIKPVETSFNAYVADLAIAYSFGTIGK